MCILGTSPVVSNPSNRLHSWIVIFITQMRSPSFGEIEVTPPASGEAGISINTGRKALSPPTTAHSSYLGQGCSLERSGSGVPQCPWRHPVSSCGCEGLRSPGHWQLGASEPSLPAPAPSRVRRGHRRMLLVRQSQRA